MHKLGLFIKSYNGHLEYTKQLVETIKKFNVDNIPTFVSVPKSQVGLFDDNIDTDYVTLMNDEEIVGKDLSDNWYGQQLVKMSFRQTNICENYLWIDADSYFIRDFNLYDFMANEDTPYTNITECRDLLTWSATKPDKTHVFQSFANDRLKVMELFGRKGKLFDSVCPNLWSSKVLKHMKKNYLDPNKMGFEELLQQVPGELIWYTEYLLATKVIDIIPTEGWFKAFHYLDQMNDCKAQGNTEKTLSYNYLGIVMPSKETRELRF